MPRGAGAEPRAGYWTRAGTAGGLTDGSGEPQRGKSLFESAWQAPSMSKLKLNLVYTGALSALFNTIRQQI